jgi:CheY-like chemotaxis protein
VFLNLLLNALQAFKSERASENTITVAISMIADEHVVIEIADTGPGIPADIQDRLFEPFFTTKDIGEGTGLGLYVCFNIVESMGGTIEVDSELGRGSTFRILLPVASWEPTPPPSLIPEQTNSRPARILLVDDEAAILRAFRRVLAGNQIRTARSVFEAQKELEEDHDIDVILCDVMMPDATGLELYQILQQKWPELANRVVFVTGGLLSSKLRRELSRLPNRCLDKPVDEATLKAVVSQAASGKGS